MKVYVFPGQGSQQKGMGAALFKRHPEMVRIADEMLGYSVEELCCHDRDGCLAQTLYTQPCLYVVNALTFMEQQADRGALPDYVAGHSLGEFNALLAAEVFDFRTGLELVRKRAQLMSQASGGSMLAVIRFPEASLRKVLSSGYTKVDIANFNSPQQVVVSGDSAEVDRLMGALQEAGATCIKLRVSAAFHSRQMKPAMESFATFIEGFQFRPPKIPVISNVTALPHDAGQLRHHLALQIVSSVKWTESIRYLLRQGAGDFLELGPGNVLTRLIDDIRKHTPAEEIRPVRQVSSDVKSPAQDVPAVSPSIAVDLEKSERPWVPSGASSSPQTRTEPAVLQSEQLGSASFRMAYGIRHAYVGGSMYKGIASKEMVVKMGKAGLLSFFGAGGLSLSRIEEAIGFIKDQLSEGKAFGMNLISNIIKPSLELDTVRLYLKHGIRCVEASAYMQMTPALVLFRVRGLRKVDGKVMPARRILAKISRPEVAQQFLSPPPRRLLEELGAQGDLSSEEIALAGQVSMADDLCVEADSAGHTDMGVASVLIPTIRRLRDTLVEEHAYPYPIHVGAAGGIGTPESAAAAFILGADFVLTGSINQCTVESGMSPAVKEMLQGMNVQDTTYAPAGDMFEVGARVQVLKKGVFFPARANKLYDTWQRYASLDEIDEKLKRQIEDKFFGRSFEAVYDETKAYYEREDPSTLIKAEQSPKHKMALIFRWYFVHSMRLALKGDLSKRVDFQVHCGPALGAFNQWVKGTPMESWTHRHVDEIGLLLMRETAAYLSKQISILQQPAPVSS